MASLWATSLSAIYIWGNRFTFAALILRGGGLHREEYTGWEQIAKVGWRALKNKTKRSDRTELATLKNSWEKGLRAVKMDMAMLPDFVQIDLSSRDHFRVYIIVSSMLRNSVSNLSGSPASSGIPDSRSQRISIASILFRPSWRTQKVFKNLCRDHGPGDAQAEGRNKRIGCIRVEWASSFVSPTPFPSP